MTMAGVTGDCSDVLIEEAMQKAQVDAGRSYNADENKSISQFNMNPKLNNPIPRSERSLEVKLARKISKRSKRDLRGLWETLVPGSTVVRTSPTTTVTKEPGDPEVRVRNNDIAKFGTCAERNTDLWQYAQRRPLPYDKTTVQKIAQHTKDLKKNYRGKSRSDTDLPSLMLLRESRPQTVTYQKPCPHASLKSLKRGELNRVSLPLH